MECNSSILPQIYTALPKIRELSAIEAASLGDSVTHLKPWSADGCHNNEHCSKHAVRAKCCVAVDDENDSSQSYN